MKWILPVILIAAMLLVAGCTTPAPVSNPVTTPPSPVTTTATVTTMTFATPVYPDLVGSWNGTSSGYLKETGSPYSRFNDTLAMNVTSQDGRLFSGEITFLMRNGTVETKPFAGALGSDGKTIATIEYPGGFCDGVLLTPDRIELVFRDQEMPSTISVDMLHRAKTPPPSSASVVPVMPVLAGTWNGTSLGYEQAGTGYRFFNLTLIMKVTGQDGRFFSGEIAFRSVNGTLVKKEFAGVLSADGTTIESIEYPSGFCDGVVISADEIELIFRDESSPSMVTIDTFRRSGASLSPATRTSPGLVGNWTGISTGYSGNSLGYTPIKGPMTLRITEQDGRFFKGMVSYLVNGTPVTKEMAGVISRDGTTLRTIETPSGLSDGASISADEIHLLYRNDMGLSEIALDSFTRAH